MSSFPKSESRNILYQRWFLWIEAKLPHLLALSLIEHFQASNAFHQCWDTAINLISLFQFLLDASKLMFERWLLPHRKANSSRSGTCRFCSL